MSDRKIALRSNDIRLGQLLKLADAVDAGSEVKTLLAAGRVTVNDDVETRRGRKIVAGDRIAVDGGDPVLVTAAS